MRVRPSLDASSTHRSPRESFPRRSSAIDPGRGHRAGPSSGAGLSVAGALLALALAAVSACGSDTGNIFDQTTATGSGGGDPAGSSASGSGTGAGSGSGGSGGSGGSPGPVCGDLLCQTGESPATCVQDCPPVCGDGACNGGETGASCSQDCGACGDGTCAGAETIANCPQDCKAVCGDDACNGGETPVSCPQDCPPVCGDSLCNGTENPQNCAQDCSCSHPVCETGGPLVADCDPCVEMVCAADPYCCDQGWDGPCVGAAESMCGAGCCGDGQCDGEDCASCEQDCGVCPPEPQCPHSVCFDGGPLDPALCFDPCADEVCMAQPACCEGSPPGWGGSCTVLAQMTCGADPCITAVCAMDPTCCTDNWTQACIDLAKTECNTQCDCAHNICEGDQPGDPLTPTCNPCVEAVCEVDPYCCSDDWDGYCVGEVETICGINCN